MNKHLLTLTLFSMLFFFAQAQISLTVDDFPNIGETVVAVNGALNQNIDIGSAGANQTYDFSAIVPKDTTASNFVDPAATPGAGTYPSATIASAFEEGFVYYRETAGEALILGT